MKRSDVDYNELSPMMKQYMDIKKDHEDELLFYRIGDFYELFFEDALEASHALELTLTGKNAGLKERVPMCGVPHHASKGYIEKAVNLGYKVAVCEQMEDPRFTKGMVKREVISVVSKGTLVDLDFLSAYDFNFIGSILDLEYAYLITYADISTGNVYSELTTHDKNTLISRILNLNLKEVILTNTFDLEILNTLKNNYNLSISISDKFYEERTKLTDNITDDRVRDGVNHLLYYLIVRELKDITHLSNVVIIDNNARLRMDVHSVRNLEIFETLRLKERQYSLIWLIDKCKTSMGSRTLKSWLMNPLRNEKMINDRLDSIDKLNNAFIKRSELTKHLYEIYDLERLCGKAICGTFNARDALQIKKSLEHLPYVKTLASEIGLNIDINTHEDLYKLLESSIYEDAPITLKDGYLIKEGYNKELDELKEIRSGGKSFIAGMEQELKEQSGISNLKVGYNKVFGYYIEISKANYDMIPEGRYIRKQTLANAERYITQELKEMEEKILGAEEKLVSLEYKIFTEIRERVEKEIPRLKKTANIIASLDVISTLAIIAVENNYVKPSINEEGVIEILEGRHPVVEKVIGNGEFICNDTHLNKNGDRFLLITGPNMAGKSTYMRQVALINLMAQIGSFVPAKSANISVSDKIFTRIGASDDLAGGKSTFMVEMWEVSNILKNATSKSLVLLDEVGRGTSTYDGLSIAWAVIEYICNESKLKCNTLFATHYHELLKVLRITL